MGIDQVSLADVGDNDVLSELVNVIVPGAPLVSILPLELVCDQVQ